MLAIIKIYQTRQIKNAPVSNNIATRVSKRIENDFFIKK